MPSDTSSDQSVAASIPAKSRKTIALPWKMPVLPKFPRRSPPERTSEETIPEERLTVQEARLRMEHSLRQVVQETEAKVGYVMMRDTAAERFITEVGFCREEPRLIPDQLPLSGSHPDTILADLQRILSEGAEGEIAPCCIPLFAQTGEGAGLLKRLYGVVALYPARRQRGGQAQAVTAVHRLLEPAALLLRNAAEAEALATQELRHLQDTIAAFEDTDVSMRGHSRRVAEVCRLLAQKLQVPEDVIAEMVEGALVHEIGTTRISPDILLKPGRLTPEEFFTLKSHTVLGYEIGRAAGLSAGILSMIRSHHERLDGTGYPDGLTQSDLSLPLRILCAADAFDAMNSYRAYRQAMDSRARDEQLNRFAGTQFAPVVVEALKALFRAGAFDALYQEQWKMQETHSLKLDWQDAA